MTPRAAKGVRLLLRTDGSSLGNPGPAAGAAILSTDDGTVVAEVVQEVGNTTNNVAEYFGLIVGLEEALKLRADEVVVQSDSQLLIRQCLGEYKIRDARLRRLSRWVGRLAEGFRRVSYRHVPREENQEADALARTFLRERKKAAGTGGS